jgi:hypothetical protein
VSETKAKYWSKLIGEQEAGGQKVRSFCRERGITEPSFYVSQLDSGFRSRRMASKLKP